MSNLSIGDGNTFGGASPEFELQPLGSMVGERFEIVRHIGRGGMGAVYECRDTVLGRHVAVKRMTQAHSETSAERFRREATAVAQLRHSGIVGIYDFGTDERGKYIVMELLKGEDLGALVSRTGRLSEDRVREIAIQAGEALEYAHSKGVVHRDIKPSNLFLCEDGQVRILDFGLARASMGDSEAMLSQVGVGMGTANFVAPEQEADATKADARSDQYSFGMTLYFLCTGRRPRMLKPQELPESVRAVVLRMLEDDPDARFPNVADAVKSLSPTPNHSTKATAGEAGTFELPAARPNDPPEIRQLRRLAEQGDVGAIAEMADLYDRGDGAFDDLQLALEEATKYYRIAFERGSLRGKAGYGRAILLGLGAPQDKARAIELLTEAADAGDSLAQRVLGDSYARGFGVRQDPKAAFHWYKLSSENGLRSGQCDHAVCLLEGFGCQQNIQDGVRLLRLSANQGYSLAMVKLGELYEDGLGVPQDHRLSAQWFRKAAEKKDPEGAWKLAIKLEYGDGVDKDPSEALHWYEVSAKARSAHGTFLLGCAYAEGVGTSVDSRRALQLFENAIELGSSQAIQALAQLYWLGAESIQQDEKKAIALLREHARKGNAISSAALGAYLLLGGRSVQANPKEAVTFLKQAVDSGDSTSAYQLGLCYLNGNGVQKNRSTALRFFRKGSENGHAESKFMLAQTLSAEADAHKHRKEILALLEETQEIFPEARLMKAELSESEDPEHAASVYEELAQIEDNEAVANAARKHLARLEEDRSLPDSPPVRADAPTAYTLQLPQLSVADLAGRAQVAKSKSKEMHNRAEVLEEESLQLAHAASESDGSIWKWGCGTAFFVLGTLGGIRAMFDGEGASMFFACGAIAAFCFYQTKRMMKEKDEFLQNSVTLHQQAEEMAAESARYQQIADESENQALG